MTLDRNYYRNDRERQRHYLHQFLELELSSFYATLLQGRMVKHDTCAHKTSDIQDDLRNLHAWSNFEITRLMENYLIQKSYDPKEGKV